MEPTQLSLLQELSQAKSATRGTSLITKFIPQGANLQLVISQLNQEISSAQNIKDKSVRQGVQLALKSGLQRLKTVDKIPENGLVLCSGEISCCI